MGSSGLLLLVLLDWILLFTHKIWIIYSCGFCYVSKWQNDSLALCWLGDVWFHFQIIQSRVGTGGQYGICRGLILQSSCSPGSGIKLVRACIWPAGTGVCPHMEGWVVVGPCGSWAMNSVPGKLKCIWVGQKEFPLSWLCNWVILNWTRWKLFLFSWKVIAANSSEKSSEQGSRTAASYHSSCHEQNMWCHAPVMRVIWWG